MNHLLKILGVLLISALTYSFGTNEVQQVNESTEICFEHTHSWRGHDETGGTDSVWVLIDDSLTMEYKKFDESFSIIDMRNKSKNQYYMDLFDSTMCYYTEEDTTRYTKKEGNRTKNILGYHCKESIFTSSRDTITVFSTTEIDLHYNHLPRLAINGTILSMTINSMHEIHEYTAVEISRNSNQVKYPDGYIHDESNEYKEKIKNRYSIRNMPIEEGQKAIAFRGKTLTDEIIDLESLNGKVVVINFWFIRCRGCVAEMPELNRVVDKFRGKEVKFIAVTYDSKNDLIKFLRRKDFDFAIVHSNQRMSYDYGINSFPTTIIIDKEGTISNTYHPPNFFSEKELVDTIQKQLDK